MSKLLCHGACIMMLFISETKLKLRSSARRSAALFTLTVMFLGKVMVLMTFLSVSAFAGTAHDFTFENIEGGPLPLAAYRGQTVLVVNTASRCGFTRQDAALQDLWQEYRDRGLVVLGVPSDDFGGQEPGTAADIKAFCEANFGIDFPMTDKVRIKGKDAHPYYKWVATQGMTKVPRWNFHKHLIDAEGNLVDWFASSTKPNAPKVIAAIEKRHRK